MTTYLEDNSTADRPDAVDARPVTRSALDMPIDPPRSYGAPPDDDVTTSGLIELILKNPPLLHRLIADRSRQNNLIVQFLTISVAAFILFGVTYLVILGGTGATVVAHPMAEVIRDGRHWPVEFQFGGPEASWIDSLNSINGYALVIAYTFGLIAATGICLPSLYFYGLLAGVRMTARDVIIHALKAKSTAAVALIGILPIYVALALGAFVVGSDEGTQRLVLLIGLSLPFIAGLWGTYSLYVGFQTLPLLAQQGDPMNRRCFLNRLVMSWCGVYTAVCPVLIHAVWCLLT